MKRVICDVDGILWRMHTPLKMLMERDGYTNLPAEPERWTWYEDFMSPKTFYKYIEKVYEIQQLFKPFSGAWELLEELDRTGHEIIIASNRNPRSAPDLAIWLRTYLPSVWSGVYAGPDKLFLIKAGDLVIDDSPKTIRYAISRGAKAWTLAYKYNRDTMAEKFQTLLEMSGRLSGLPKSNENEGLLEMNDSRV